MILTKNIWNEKLRCAEFFPRNEIVSEVRMQNTDNRLELRC